MAHTYSTVNFPAGSLTFIVTTPRSMRSLNHLGPGLVTDRHQSSLIHSGTGQSEQGIQVSRVCNTSRIRINAPWTVVRLSPSMLSLLDSILSVIYTNLLLSTGEITRSKSRTAEIQLVVCLPVSINGKQFRFCG